MKRHGRRDALDRNSDTLKTGPRVISGNGRIRPFCRSTGPGQSGIGTEALPLNMRFFLALMILVVTAPLMLMGKTVSKTFNDVDGAFVSSFRSPAETQSAVRGSAAAHGYMPPPIMIRSRQKKLDHRRARRRHPMSQDCLTSLLTEAKGRADVRI